VLGLNYFCGAKNSTIAKFGKPFTPHLKYMSDPTHWMFVRRGDARPSDRRSGGGGGMVLEGGGSGGGALGERGGGAGALERGAGTTGGVRGAGVSGIRGKGGFGGGFGKRCGSWSQLDFFWSPLLGLAQPVPESFVCGAC